MRRLSHLPTLTVICALAALALPVAAASASMHLESIFEDENLLIGRGQMSALDEMKALGADTVRSNVFWKDLAPRPKSAKRPKGFKAGKVASYPAAAWDRYDDFVRQAGLRGLNVLLTPTGPIPRWASHCKGSARAVDVCRPDVRLYAGFVRALGERFSGRYADENQGGGVLPRVTRWSLWNEPNQPGWLNPQLVRAHGHLHDFAADRYRSLARAGIRSLQAGGHGGELILLGETAPIGRVTGTPAVRATAPVPFIQQLLCLRSDGHRLRGREAKASGCRRIPRFAVSGFAHHPYTRGGSQPPYARTLSTEITVTKAVRLKRLLDQGARARMLPARLPIWYTEFGYQTNPPDPLFGVTLEQQARYINQADYLAARDPRVRSVAQYELVDDQDQQSFQTGLRRFGSGKVKPAYAAYRLPIWTVRRGASVRVYGQVRPAPPASPEQVEIQNAPKARGPWQTVQTITVNSDTGQFLQSVPARAGVWRLRWTPSTGGPARTSRLARAGRR